MITSRTAIELHSDIAEKFDQRYSTQESFLQRRWLFNALAKKYFPSPGTIIDIGCGSGVLMLDLVEDGHFVTGIDGSTEMIALCRDRMSRRPGASFNLSKGFLPDALMALPSNSQDGIIASSVLEYLDDFEPTLDHIARLLKPGGILIASMPNPASFYRKIERTFFHLFGFPRYLQFVKNYIDPVDFISFMQLRRCEFVEQSFFAPKGALFRRFSRFLPARLIDNLYINVYRKLS